MRNSTKRNTVPSLAVIVGLSLFITGCSGGGAAETAEEPTEESSEQPAVRGDEDLIIWAGRDYQVLRGILEVLCNCSN